MANQFSDASVTREATDDCHPHDAESHPDASQAAEPDSPQPNSPDSLLSEECSAAGEPETDPKIDSFVQEQDNEGADRPMPINAFYGAMGTNCRTDIFLGEQQSTKLEDYLLKTTAVDSYPAFATDDPATLALQQATAELQHKRFAVVHSLKHAPKRAITALHQLTNQLSGGEYNIWMNQFDKPFKLSDLGKDSAWTATLEYAVIYLNFTEESEGVHRICTPEYYALIDKLLCKYNAYLIIATYEEFDRHTIDEQLVRVHLDSQTTPNEADPSDSHCELALDAVTRPVAFVGAFFFGLPLTSIVSLTERLAGAKLTDSSAASTTEQHAELNRIEAWQRGERDHFLREMNIVSLHAESSKLHYGYGIDYPQREAVQLHLLSEHPVFLSTCIDLLLPQYLFEADQSEVFARRFRQLCTAINQHNIIALSQRWLLNQLIEGQTRFQTAFSAERFTALLLHLDSASEQQVSEHFLTGLTEYMLQLEREWLATVCKTNYKVLLDSPQIPEPQWLEQNLQALGLSKTHTQLTNQLYTLLALIFLLIEFTAPNVIRDCIHKLLSGTEAREQFKPLLQREPKANQLLTPIYAIYLFLTDQYLSAQPNRFLAWTKITLCSNANNTQLQRKSPIVNAYSKSSDRQEFACSFHIASVLFSFRNCVENALVNPDAREQFTQLLLTEHPAAIATLLADYALRVCPVRPNQPLLAVYTNTDHLLEITRLYERTSRVIYLYSQSHDAIDPLPVIKNLVAPLRAQLPKQSSAWILKVLQTLINAYGSRKQRHLQNKQRSRARAERIRYNTTKLLFRAFRKPTS